MKWLTFRLGGRLLRWWLGKEEWKLLMEELDRGYVVVGDWAGARRAWTRVQMRMKERQCSNR